MIDLPSLAAFVVAAFVLTVTPGIDTAIVLRSATMDGRRPAILAAIGIGLGCLIWGAAVAVGLGALLRASELAYTAIKLVGAAYLLWIGARLLLHPRTMLDTAATPSPPRAARAFVRGFLTNLLNPKVGVFYVTFLPQFVPTDARIAEYTFFLACVHVALTLAWFATLIAALGPLGALLRRPPVVRTLDRLTGGVFVAFGIRLAASRAH